MRIDLVNMKSGEKKMLFPDTVARAEDIAIEHGHEFNISMMFKGHRFEWSSVAKRFIRIEGEKMIALQGHERSHEDVFEACNACGGEGHDSNDHKCKTCRGTGSRVRGARLGTYDE